MRIGIRYYMEVHPPESTKTISILQDLTLWAYSNHRRRVTLGAESMPVIRKTIFPDWRDVVMKEAYDRKRLNKSEMIYTFPTGTVFNFVPTDDETRWTGMRQDICYFDEVNHVPMKVYDQADIRTELRMLSSFNPAAEFWLKARMDMPDTFVDHSTYHDNPFLADSIKRSLEARALTDPNFYKVYTLGQWGTLEGLIYREGINWDIIDTMPEYYDKRVLSIDFGYSVDPCVILDVRYFRGEIWADEVEYRTGMLNSDIHHALYRRGRSLRAVADAAEPKSIEEIYSLGYDIHPSIKGQGSVNSGISLVKEFKVNVTKRSINLIKSLRNYHWATDKHGNSLNKPDHFESDGCDALRYGVGDLHNRRVIKFK